MYPLEVPDSWLDQISLLDVIFGLGGLLAVVLLIGVVVKIARTVNPYVVKLIRVFDLILGKPEEQGLPAQKGFAQRLDDQDERLAKIEKQVTPNHGSTNMLSEDVQELKASLAALIERFEAHLTR